MFPAQSGILNLMISEKIINVNFLGKNRKKAKDFIANCTQ